MIEEKHHKPKELGGRIGMSATSIIRWINNHPDADVLRLPNPGTQR
jgi:hypothetical protein